MAIQWMDNFGWCGTGAASLPFLLSGTPYGILANTTGYYGGVTTDPVISGGVCLQVGQTLSNYDNTDNALNLPAPTNKVGVAKRWYSAGGAQRSITQYLDVYGNVICRVVAETTGAISVYGSGLLAGPLLGTTTVPVITFNTWWHIETFFDNSGIVDVYVEGVKKLTATYTGPGTSITGVGWSPRYGEGSPGGTVLLKDLVIYDTTGTVNNTSGSIGPRSVYRLVLNSDVSNGWTITGGTTVNGTISGEPPLDSSQYISAGSSIPAPAICGIASLPTSIISVSGVMSLQRTSKSDGGVATYQVDLKSGSATHTGTTHSAATSYNYQWDVVELDPNTGVLWTPTAVDNLKVEINRIT